MKHFYVSLLFLIWLFRQTLKSFSHDETFNTNQIETN